MHCPVCLATLELQARDVMPDALCEQWGLNAEERQVINRREGDICSDCGSSLRLIAFAETIVSVLQADFGVEAACFKDVPTALAGSRRSLDIWECNNISVLHPYISSAPGLVYTEYGSTLPEVASEDLMGLSFANDSFDLILMTDVLEHVPDLDAAFRELSRVLKPGGRLVLTVPLLMNRKTRQRAVLEDDGSLRKLLAPSYHGAPGNNADDLLVIHEFGGDAISYFDGLFDVCSHNENQLPLGANTVFVLKHRGI